MRGNWHRYCCGGNARKSPNPQNAGAIITILNRKTKRGFPDGLLLVLLVALGSALGRIQTIARDHGQVDIPSSVIQHVINPVAVPAARGLLSLSEFGMGVLHARSLAIQNEALKAQLVGYEAYSERVSYLNQQIEGLRKQLSLPSTQRSAVNLDVIGISQSDGSLILDGGSELGIRPDLPVINGDGLIGLVQTVTKGEARVAMLTAYGMKIFAVDSSRTPPEEGLINGTGESTLTMRMLNAKDPVASGDVILTTLKSVHIPPGLVVGRVISVEDDPDFGTRRLTVDPAVNLGIIHQVQVLK